MEIGIVNSTPTGNDNTPQSPGGIVEDIAMGIRLYSIIPIPKIAHHLPSLNRIAPVLWFVSIVVSLPGALAFCVGLFVGLNSFAASIVALGVNAIVTGAMAEDAVADSYDGLGGRDSLHTLEIMRDPRHGTYGSLALVLFVLARVGGLAMVGSLGPLAGLLAFLGVQVFARSFSMIPAAMLKPASSTGSGASAGQVTALPLTSALAFSALVGLVVLSPFVGWLGYLIILVVSGAVGLLWTWFCKRRLGGFTGDLLGGGQAMIELAIALSLTALI